MGGGSRRGIEAAFKQPVPVTTPGIGDGVPGNRPMGGTPDFLRTFGDMLTQQQGAPPRGVVPSVYSEMGMARPISSAEAMGGSIPPPRLSRSDRPDYEAELAKLSQPERETFLQRLVQALPTAAAFANGDTSLGIQLMGKSFDRQRDQRDKARDYKLQDLKWRYEDWARQNGADLKAADPTTINNNMVRYNPLSGQAESIYQAPTDGEIYAQAQGLKPGTPEYAKALQDHVLRANGPTAYGYDVQLDDRRTSNRARLETQRQGNRTSLEDQRQAGRVNLRRIPPPPRFGGAGRENLPTVNTPAEAMALPPGTKFRTPDGQIKVRP